MFKNNSKMRTWDDSVFFRPGKIILTGKSNPYKKNTLEFELVDFIMRQSQKKITSTLSTEILSHLKTKKVLLSIDTWSFNDLGNRAVWLSLSAGCIKFSNEKTKNINFAVHLQSGLLDLFHEPAYLNKLTLNAPNTEHLEHLKQVALLSSDLKKTFNLPVMKETGGKIEITNYASWMLERAESIPIQTWSKANIGYVQAKTRGIFHHLGDEMSFICAATQYGSCYIVGNDEFGDLIILGIIPNKNSSYADYNLGGIYDSMDFDYIYGVPVTNALYPAWRNHCFNYASENYEQCQLNNKPNSELSNKYWENDFFVKEAQREIKALSVKEFSLKMSDIIKNIMTPEDYEIYKNLFNGEFFININTLFCSNYISFHTCINEIHNNNNLDGWKDYYDELLSSRLSVEDVLTVAETIKERNKSKKGFMNLMDNVIQKIIIMKKLTMNYNKLFEEQFSFFYKTVSHKVHCDIINPKKIETSGFFMKDGNNSSAQKINLLNIFSEFIENIWLDKNYMIGYGSSLNKIRKKFLKDYKNNNDLFESIHKTALKKNIAEQLNPSENIYELIDFWDELNIPAFVVSNIIDMQNEYRIFVINNRPVSGSPCFRNTTPFNAWDNGRFDARLCKGHSAYDSFENDDSRARVAQYARYAKKFARELKIQYPEQNNFVLDVAYSQDANNGVGGIVPIEINSITWSGAYQIDFRRVCAAIAKKPYHFSDMDEYGDFKNLLLQAKQKLEVIRTMDDLAVNTLLNNLTGENFKNDGTDEDEYFEKENDKQL